MKEASRQNKQMMLLFLKKSLVWGWEIGHSKPNLDAKTDPYNFKLAPKIFEKFCTVKKDKI